MNEAESVHLDPQKQLAHTVLNHMHVILGNLELLEDERPDDRLLSDARAAAVEVHQLLRGLWGR